MLRYTAVLRGRSVFTLSHAPSLASPTPTRYDLVLRDVSEGVVAEVACRLQHLHCVTVNRKGQNYSFFKSGILFRAQNYLLM